MFLKYYTQYIVKSEICNALCALDENIYGLGFISKMELGLLQNHKYLYAGTTCVIYLLFYILK